MTRATKTTGGWNYGSPSKSEIENFKKVLKVLWDFGEGKYGKDKIEAYARAVSAITDMMNKRVIEEFEELARIGKVAFLQSFVKARLAQLKSKAPEEDS